MIARIEPDPTSSDFARQSEALQTFADQFGSDLVLTDPDVVAAYAMDQASFLSPQVAGALARPRNTAEVTALLAAAHKLRLTVVPRGAGSGLSGGANTVEGCVILSTEKMKDILEVSDQDLVAVAHAGVITGELKRAALEVGLSYPPDPSSFDLSTIGGNVATDAGGLCCGKYGSTRNWVLGLEAVRIDGSVFRTGTRSLATSAGYSITGLLTGSEGTLAVITEVTLRLIPQPRPAATLVGYFDSVIDAGQAVTSLCRFTRPSILEIMDRTTIDAVDSWKHLDLDRDAGALLFAQTDAPTRESQDAELATMTAIFEEHGATWTGASSDQEEADALLDARRLAYPALERLGHTLLDDVAVPRSRLAELIQLCEQVGERSGVKVATFGHAAAGNLHPTLVWEPGDIDGATTARAAFDEIVAGTLRLGGTITGEHGVGLLKAESLVHQLHPVDLEIQRAIKRAFDPEGLLNPGKAVTG